MSGVDARKADARKVDAKTFAKATIDSWSGRLIGLSQELHADPELAFAEHRSAERVAALLTDAGFRVEQGLWDLPTALSASYGEGDLVVGICAEYDALPGIGHACGHNIIASSAVGAAIGLAGLADQLGIRVKLLGTPAEEHGGGKVLMLERGAFEDVTVAMMVHPGQRDVRPCDFNSQAVSRFRVTYKGVSSHAAAAPERGVNAADAAVIAQVAIGQLRQQVSRECRLSAFVSNGGEVTNIIPSLTTIEAEARAYTVEETEQLKERMLRCFEAGAIASGCSWEVEDTEPLYADLLQDRWLGDAFAANITALGRELTEVPARSMGGSTDMGNVTQALPGIHPSIGVLGSESAPHTTGFAADAASPAGDQAVLDGALAMAWTAIDLAADPEQRARVLAARA